MEKRIPEYLYSAANLKILVVATALFAVVFINVYNPFNSKEWFVLTDFRYVLYSVLMVLVGFAVVTVSRVVMNRVCRKRPVMYWQYVLWCLLEALVMSLCYTAFGMIVSENVEALSFEENVVTVFEKAVKNTVLILLLPYAVLILYFSWKDNKARLESMAAKSTEGDSPSGKGAGAAAAARRMLMFYDEKGELRLSIVPENLLYIEAADNYVEIHYLIKDTLSKYLLRNSLRAMEQAFGKEGMVRCHRSYLVNIAHVKVIRRENHSLLLEMDVPGVPDIPISATYYLKVSEVFMSGMK